MFLQIKRHFSNRHSLSVCLAFFCSVQAVVGLSNLQKTKQNKKSFRHPQEIPLWMMVSMPKLPITREFVFLYHILYGMEHTGGFRMYKSAGFTISELKPKRFSLRAKSDVWGVGGENIEKGHLQYVGTDKHESYTDQETVRCLILNDIQHLLWFVLFFYYYFKE